MGVNDDDYWIQVDFLYNVIMKGIYTQGSAYREDDQWVEDLQVQIGFNVASLSYIMEEGMPKVGIIDKIVKFPIPKIEHVLCVTQIF